MRTPSIILVLLCSGCADQASRFADLTTAGAAAQPSAAACEHFELEPDFAGSALAGPGVADGGLMEGDYIISSTYLQLRAEPEVGQRFGELMQPIMADLMSRDGLVALSFGDSKRCGTARTLAVWRDEVAMFGFVIGEAHGRAVQAIDQLSRGRSVVMHWRADKSGASWSSAMNYLAEAEGPFY